MKNSRMSSWSLTTKFFMAMLLILIVVGGIAASNILMSRQVEKTLAPLIGNDVKQIIRNAALTRELNAIFSDINLLSNTFTESSSALENRSAKLFAQLQNQISAFEQSGTIQESLLRFQATLKTFVAQCQKILVLSQELKASDADIELRLADLENIVTNMLLQAKASETGEAYSTYSIEQIISTIPDLRNLLLQVKFQLAELTRASEFRAAYGCRRTAHHRKSRRLVRQPANNRHRRRRACAVGKPPHRVHPAISAANSGVSRRAANLSGKFPENDAGAGAGHGGHARH